MGGRDGHGVERMRRIVGHQEFGSGGCVFHDSESEGKGKTNAREGSGWVGLGRE